MNRLTGKWYKIADGRDSYEFFEGDYSLVFPLAVHLEKRFPFTRLPVISLDQIFISYEHLMLGWDIWSGLFLQANSQEGNRVLHEIAAEVENLVNDLLNQACDDQA